MCSSCLKKTILRVFSSIARHCCACWSTCPGPDRRTREPGDFPKPLEDTQKFHAVQHTPIATTVYHQSSTRRNSQPTTTDSKDDGAYMGSGNRIWSTLDARTAGSQVFVHKDSLLVLTNTFPTDYIASIHPIHTQRSHNCHIGMEKRCFCWMEVPNLM